MCIYFLLKFASIYNKLRGSCSAFTWKECHRLDWFTRQFKPVYLCGQANKGEKLKVDVILESQSQIISTHFSLLKIRVGFLWSNINFKNQSHWIKEITNSKYLQTAPLKNQKWQLEVTLYSRHMAHSSTDTLSSTHACKGNI